MSDRDPLFPKSIFLPHWIILSTLGLILGNLMSWFFPRLALSGAKALEHALAFVVPNHGLGAVIVTIPSYLVTTTSVGTIIGLCLVGAQWLVLRRWKVVWAKEWLLAGGIGAVLSYFLMADLNILAILFDPDPRLLKGLADSGLWIGTILGVAQWWVLRKYNPQAGWWIVASTGIWGTGFILNRLFGQQVADRIGYSLILWLRMELEDKLTVAPRSFLIGQVVIWIIAGIVAGFITGRMLKWLMKSQPES